MLEALKWVLSPEYLAVAEPGPMGGLWVLYIFLTLVFAGGLAAAASRLIHPGAQDLAGRGSARAGGWLLLWVCLAGLSTVAGRFLSWPGWSARIWPYTLLLLALVGFLGIRFHNVRLPGDLAWRLSLLALLAPPACEVPKVGQRGRAPIIAGLLLHLGGIALVLSARYGWPVWSAPAVLLAVLAPQWPRIVRGRAPRPEGLIPLLAVYTVTLIWLLYLRLGITVIPWQGLAFPNPLLSLFYVDGIVLAAVILSLLCQMSLVTSESDRSGILWRWAVGGLLVLTLAWAGGVYFGKRTHGATATDPYAYAQMGVDLAERGTFLHRFALFQQVIPLEIAWAPLQPLGYHIPRNDLGDCPSVWATGASVLLAGGYRLLGEVGLYVTTPIVALLSLAATWALAHEALRGQPLTLRHLTAALAVGLLATSPEHVDRLLVPMADAPAQLFTVLTLLFAVRAMHNLEDRGRVPVAALALAGACFGWAYWVRHTQLVLAIPAVLAILLGLRRRAAPDSPLSTSGAGHRSGHGWSLALASGLLFFGCALLAALPDIVYRWRVFGGPFRTETTELPLMALRHIGPVAWQMLRDALVAGEWGYLFPLALYGGYRMARDHGRELAVLGLAFGAVLLVHLTYRSLRLRDLLSLFPLLDLAVAYGAVVLVRELRSAARRYVDRLGPILVAAGAVAWVILSLALARWAMIDNLWKPGWASFGYMGAEHRAAFDRLRALTPPDAVIGASLNAGAVMLYSRRDAIRPYDSWTVAEWEVFLDAMRGRERPVYLLDDGGLMAAFIREEQARRRLTPVEPLPVPLFYAENRETGWLYRLEWER